MMKKRSVLLMVAAVTCGVLAAPAGSLLTKWAYHDDGDDIDDRDTERAPGREHTFIGEGATMFDDGSALTLYVLTDHEFAGDLEEQVFVRWWNGQEEHWIMGSWEANIRLGETDDGAGKFHGLPQAGSEMLDLWKIEIKPEVTKPGENFYVIQLKGWEEGGAEEVFLLRDPAGADGPKNELGQAWIANGEYFGHDWSVTIME